MGGGTSSYQRNDPFLTSAMMNATTPSPKELYDNLQIDYLLGEGGYSKVYHGIQRPSTSPPPHNLNINPQQSKQRQPKPEEGEQRQQNQQQNHVAIKILNLEKFVSLTPPSSASEEYEIAISSKETESSLITIINELNAFKKMESSMPFIVKLNSAFRYRLSCYFVMDCLSGGDLRNYLRRHGPLDEPSVVYFVACIGSALHYIHEKGVIHRDVKPENIGLDSLGRPCLTDFGISLVATTDNPIPLSTSSSGTLPYLAPEVLSPGNCHSYQADYWSLGVMTFELLFNQRPFRRHCPVQSLHFVSNEYGWLWQDLLRRSKSSRPVTANPNTSPSTSENVQNYDREFDSIPLSPLVNFEEIPRPQEWQLPFPDSQFSLNADGTAPNSLVVIPDRDVTLACSHEMKSLLNGLLDVRIPHRLGSLTRYADFEHHPCLALHGLNFKELPSLESPLLHTSFYLPPTGSFYHSRSPKQSIIDSDENFNNFESQYLHHLKPQLRHQLMQFYYFPPPSSASSSSIATSDRLKLKLPSFRSQLYETGDSLFTTRLTGRNNAN